MKTANSRHDTGKFRKAKARELGRLNAVDVSARLLASLALLPPWLPIVHILASHALFSIL
jgi:hypothetical protein